ncbi:hypothetical protein [Mycoplasma sp. 654]|uniref:hypothetical protein n=1 Tax=unclassified Mycoplasma TaxID=2683645 RepID=UPI003A86E06A
MNKNKITLLNSLKNFTIVNILLIIIIPIILLIIRFAINSESLTFVIVFSLILSILWLTFLILLLITTAKLAKILTGENKLLLWASYILLFLIPIAAWIINFVVISDERTKITFVP